MFVVPEPVGAGDKILPSGYACPTCRHQTYPSKNDTGWVRCPLVRNRPICLGCCLDIQGAARSDEFSIHPDKRIFDKLTRSENKPIVRLRLICLDHQLQLVDKKLSEADDGQHPARHTLRKRIVSARDETISEP